MLDESSEAFLDKHAAEDADRWRFDLDLPGVSEPLGQVGVADMKGSAVEAFVGDDQVASAPCRVAGFHLGDGHRGISDFDATP